MAADDHAVLVGINRYPHLGNLKGPENDVKAIKEWLEDPAGGDIPTKNIQLITSSKFAANGGQAKPTAEDVFSRFGTLNDRGRTAMPEPLGRRLYIFLAGHGASLPGDIFEAVLLTANAKRGEISHYVPGRMVVSHFGSAAFFREIVMFMDCCRDTLPKLKLRALPWDTVQGETDEDVKYCLCFATRWSRKTRERDFEDEGSRGIFTRSLLEGLRAGFDTPSELENFVLQRLPVVAGKKGYRPPEFNYSDEDMKLSAGDAADSSCCASPSRVPMRA